MGIQVSPQVALSSTEAEYIALSTALREVIPSMESRRRGRGWDSIVKRQDSQYTAIKLTQPHLIDQILSDLRLTGEFISTKSNPTSSSHLMRRDPGSEDFNGHFNYRSAVGKLGYLCSTQPDISYAVHQSARFSAKHKKAQAKALHWRGRYFLETKDKDSSMTPRSSRSIAKLTRIRE